MTTKKVERLLRDGCFPRRRGFALHMPPAHAPTALQPDLSARGRARVRKLLRGAAVAPASGVSLSLSLFSLSLSLGVTSGMSVVVFLERGERKRAFVWWQASARSGVSGAKKRSTRNLWTRRSWATPERGVLVPATPHPRSGASRFDATRWGNSRAPPPRTAGGGAMIIDDRGRTHACIRKIASKKAQVLKDSKSCILDTESAL